MSPIQGYTCYYCSNKTLYKENFVELEINNQSRLYCINCAGYFDGEAVVDDLVDDIEDGMGVVDDRDYVNYDKAMAAREALFLLDSEPSFLLFEESSLFIEDEAYAAGDREDVSHDKARAAREASFLLDSESSFFLFEESSSLIEDEGNNEAEAKHLDAGYYRKKASTLAVELLELGRHEPDLSQVGLDIVELFQDADPLPLTDMQKRELRIALKNIKRRGHA